MNTFEITIFGQAVRVSTPSKGQMLSSRRSPDTPTGTGGTRVVTASRDDTARGWDAASGEALLTLAGHSNEFVSAVFSPDGTQVLTASRDTTARVWDAFSGEALLTLAGHSAPVVSAVFSPDGTRVLTASYDNTAKVWDAASGEALLTLAGHNAWVYSAVFSPNGTQVLTASGDPAKVWLADIDQLLRLAEQRIQRDPPLFNPEERQRYGLE